MGTRIRRAERPHPDGRHEADLRRAGYRWVCGLDEVGRGPLAGPVVVAAVILDPDCPVPGLDDSKCLRPAVRLELARAIMRTAVAYRLVAVGPREIDRINILEATKCAMTRAVRGLAVTPDALLIDALVLPELPQHQVPLIRGDCQSASIAAASILAKVARDGILCAYAEQYPAYGFERHKGYGTRAHCAALDRLGATPIHRQTFLTKWRIGGRS